MGQQDDIVVLPWLQRLDDLLIKRTPQSLILQLGFPQVPQETVFFPFGYLPGFKFQVNQIPPRRAGHGFFQQIQIAFRLVLGNQGQGLVQFGDNLPLRADITAPDPSNGVAIGAETAAQFAQLFLIHSCSSLCQTCNFWKGLDAR